MATIFDTAAQRVGASYQAKTGTVAPISIITAILSAISTLLTTVCPASTPAPTPTPTTGDTFNAAAKENSIGTRYMVTYATIQTLRQQIGPKAFLQYNGQAIVDSIIEVGATSTPAEINEYAASIPQS